MTFPRYPKYKDSGVEWLGEVPEGWEVKPLKRLSSCNDDVLPESTDPETEIEYVDISSVSSERGIEKTEPMRFEAAPSRARRRVNSGDVVISTVRTYLKAIASVTKQTEQAVFSTGFAVIRPQEGFEPAFARYALHANYFMDQVVAESVGVSYPAINSSELVTIKVVLPPPSEQTTIATFLDRETAKIGDLISDQERLIELLQEKRQALISHAVTKGLNPDVPMKDSGVEWLGYVPEHWEVKRIKHFTNTIEQGWSPQCEGYPIENPAEWGVLKVGCVNGGIFNPAENKKLPDDLTPLPELGITEGDVLVSRANTRELVGSSAVAMRPFLNLLLCDKLYRLRLNKDICLPSFLSNYLGVDMVRGQIELAATGASSSMLNIGQSTILDLEIALPSVEEQVVVTDFINHETTKLDNLIDDSHQFIELLKERRTALISAAVTGKIDVLRKIT